MFSPANMSFQYFFFDTYPGYFLQMLPIALLAGILYFVCKKKKAPAVSRDTVAVASLFPAYIAALVGLTLLIEFIRDGYFFLFYHMSPWSQGEGGYTWFSFIYDFKLDFFRNFTAENVGNIVLFLPFGILHPLFNRHSTWKRTLVLGILTSLLIENIQPFMDRSFDLNDLVLNTMGVAVSTLLFYTVRRIRHRRSPNAAAG